MSRPSPIKSVTKENNSSYNCFFLHNNWLSPLTLEVFCLCIAKSQFLKEKTFRSTLHCQFANKDDIQKVWFVLNCIWDWTIAVILFCNFIIHYKYVYIFIGKWSRVWIRRTSSGSTHSRSWWSEHAR